MLPYINASSDPSASSGSQPRRGETPIAMNTVHGLISLAVRPVITVVLRRMVFDAGPGMPASMDVSPTVLTVPAIFSSTFSGIHRQFRMCGGVVSGGYGVRHGILGFDLLPQRGQHGRPRPRHLRMPSWRSCRRHPLFRHSGAPDRRDHPTFRWSAWSRRRPYPLARWQSAPSCGRRQLAGRSTAAGHRRLPCRRVRRSYRCSVAGQGRHRQ